MNQLTILQINVDKGATQHEIALSSAYNEQIDVVLIQEPYISRDLPRRITKRHPSFNCFTPIDDWADSQPRVLTYVRKGAGLRTTQIRPDMLEQSALPDLLFLQIQAPSGQPLLILNVYNAPPGSIRPGLAAQALTSLPPAFLSQPLFLAGDLNLLHRSWQPSLERGQTAFADPFVAWLDESQLVFISEVDRPTHDKGNVLDLAFSSATIALEGAKTVVVPHLDVTSDHRPLLTCIPWDQRFAEPARKLRFDTLDQPLFLSLLAANCSGLAPPADTEASLDSCASRLVSSIHQAYAGAARRSLGSGIGQPWWNTECNQARLIYRAGECTKRSFRSVVRRAQRGFWRDKLDQASKAKDVFDMTKWHKSTGSYHSPPLKDPQHPDRPPATTPLAKQTVLINNLLQNTAKAGDIPMDCPTAPTAALPFLEVTELSIQQAILQAGNTAPGIDEIPTCVLKVAWPLIKDLVLQLFQGCLRLGYHPKCFRQAVLAIIQKPKKDDRSSPRSYRPIALLSVLGQGTRTPNRPPIVMDSCDP